jgi:hypothetical protein
MAAISPDRATTFLGWLVNELDSEPLDRALLSKSA